MTAVLPFSPAFISIPEYVALHARNRPDDPAFSDGESVRSWRQFDADTEMLARQLRGVGVQDGEAIAVLAGNSIWAYTVIFGIIRAGGVVCPLSSLLNPELLAALLDDANATRCFVSTEYRQLAEAACAIRSGDTALLVEDSAAQSLVGCDYDGALPTPSAETPCNIIYSSGTTGRPKGIVHSHGARMGFATSMALGLRVHASCRSLLSTPPNSNGTWLLMLPTVLLGGMVITGATFDAASWLQQVDQHRPTHAFVVPTQIQALADVPGVNGDSFASFECIVSAGAPIHAALKQRFRALCNQSLYELWGFTESVGTIIAPSEMAQRPQSVGRAWPGCELRIIDPEDRDITGSGAGEIVGRTTSMMSGYHLRPDANAEIEWRDGAGRLFFRTGDIGEIDGEGYLTLRGRLKDMILSGGLNVFPVDIEAQLVQHDAVRDAAVVGVPHDKWGETPVAFVLRCEDRNITAEALREWANARLAKFQRLADVVLVEGDFPRNALGKVIKPELVSRYRDG